MKKTVPFATASPNMQLSFKMIVFSLLSFLIVQSTSAQQWTIIGNEAQLSAVTSSYTSVTAIGDVPYVVYREGTETKVKTKNTATGNWQQVGNIVGLNYIHTKILIDKKNNLFVSFVDVSNGNKLGVKTYNTDLLVWEPMNNNSSNLYVSTGSVTYTESRFNSSARSSMAFDSDNNPYIAFGEGVNLTPNVKKFDGTAWVTVGSVSVNDAARAVAPCLVIDEADALWLTYVSLSTSTSTNGDMALYKFTGNAWVNIAVTIASIRHTTMALNAAGNLAIAYFNIGNLNRATVIVYNKTDNTFGTATALSSRDAPNLSIISDIAGNLYCSFIDNMASTPTYVARVFKQAANASTWTELKDPAITGIDAGVGNLNIAVGTDVTSPFVVYLKTNSSSVYTPIVRKFTPPAPPSVLTTNAVSNITTTSFVSGGNITSDGGSAVTERGIVYSTNAYPTTANTKVVNASGGIGSFSATATNLIPATFYNVRSYAINSGGTSYGDNLRLNTLPVPDAVVTAPKQMEFLTRGVVAMRTSASKVFISWRLLGTDPATISFNIYSNGTKLNTTPIINSTNFDHSTSTDASYTIVPILNGIEGTASAPVSVWANNQLTIPMQIPAGGTSPDGVSYTYSANDCSVGDVDGDGEYEIFVKWTPSNKTDNLGGYTGNQLIDCYKLNGTKLWQINLGTNIRAGDHYTQFMVYDFDGDGKAEMVCKTADSTVDGKGVIIGNPLVDYRSSDGWVLTGPEFLTVFNGLTGAAMATVNFQPARGATTDWGDAYGNRADRFISAVAYLDGVRPSIIVGRGYYNKLVRAAYDWRNGQLTLRWIFNSNDAGNGAYASMGNHQMTVGDVDGDGKDEIFNGSSAINDNGGRLWTSGNGHGDALHMTDMDPDLPGQEMWQCLESPGQYSPLGLRFNDAKTGATLWGVPTTGDVGRAMAADIDPTHRGYEVWGSSGNLYDCKGNQISTNKPSFNFGIWWDGDLARELLDGNVLDKWNPVTNTMGRLFTIYNAAPVTSNNSTKKNPCLMADLIGDWREEIILRKSDNTALVLFSTTSITDQRIYTLMHDPQYRTAIAWQNSGYNQPPYPSFYLGYDMPAPPVANIYLAGQQPAPVPVKLLSFNATAQNKHVIINWSATNEINSKYYDVERSQDGRLFSTIATVNDKGNTGVVNHYSIVDDQPLDGVCYYRLKQVDVDGKFEYSIIKTVRFSKVKQLNIYPNPATTNVTLSLTGNGDNLNISISNIDGKLVYQGRGSLMQINKTVNHLLPALTKGYYNIQLTNTEGVYRAKLIKQ